MPRQPVGLLQKAAGGGGGGGTVVSLIPMITAMTDLVIARTNSYGGTYLGVNYTPTYLGSNTFYQLSGTGSSWAKTDYTANPITLAADFSIEIACRLDGTGVADVVYGGGNINVSLNPAANTLLVRVGAVVIFNSVSVTAGSFPTATWLWCVVRRIGSTVSFWVNGVQLASATESSSHSISGEVYLLNHDVGTNTLVGRNCTEFRIVKDGVVDVTVQPTARYTYP